MSNLPTSGGAPKTRPRVSLFGRAAQPMPASQPPLPGAPEKKPRRSTFSKFSGFLSFLMIALLVVLGGYMWMTLQARKAGPLAADKVVVITREDNDGSIAEQLEHAGVIDSALWFSAVTILDGNSRSLKRGEYEFKAGSSIKQVEEVLAAGKTLLHSVTVPEGLTSEQIVQRLRENEFLSGDIKDAPREGSILPDTYKFAKDWPRQKIIAKMVEDQTKAVAEIWQKRARDLPIKSPGELVTLASIVEKETGKADERPHVAGIFINRLQKRMKLQSDPTIVYGLVFGKGTLGHSITKAELDQATPYNTYVIEGLPPGPIANPGRAAMEAVANPTHTKDLYFVADGTGGHAFAETLDQHLKNVAHWRQVQQDNKDRVAPDVSPSPAPAAQTHGEAAPLDPQAFGSLAAIGNSPEPRALAGLAHMLGRVGAGRAMQDSLLAPGGQLSSQANTRSLADLGLVIAGVNDQVAEAAAPDADAPLSNLPAAMAPLSPAAMADLQAREARYGAGRPTAGPRPVQFAEAAHPQPGAGPRPRAFDASEGTSLDPLLNKSFDLTTAKVVPSLK